MVMHVLIFKTEISSYANLEKFSISKVKKLLKGIPSLVIEIIEIIQEYTIDTYKIINDKLANDMFNPVKLLSEVIIFQDNSDEAAAEQEEKGAPSTNEGYLGAINSWLIFFKNNWLMILILISAVYFVILPALAIVLAHGLLGIPRIIITVVLLYICAICVGLCYLIFFRDNTTEILNCAEGLDASGNLKNIETMTNKDKLKIKLCKYWLESVEPITLIFPSLNKSKHIKIVKVIKDATGKVIKVMLPGNVIYDVKSQDTISEDESTPELRTIYMEQEKINLLKNNMALFKVLKDDIYNYKDLFKTFMDDYKTNMMVYFGINNINMFFFYTFVIIFSLNLTDTIRNLMSIRNSTVLNHIIVDSSRNSLFIILVVILKTMTITTPLKHIFKIFAHLDLVKDKIFGSQAQFLLFEIIVYLLTGFHLLMLAITNNSEVIICFGPATAKTWIIILWFLACTIKILLGDVIICEVDGTYKKGKICNKSIFTDLQRIQECDKLSKVLETEVETEVETETFTNISNRKSINNLLGYSPVRERFTVNDGIDKVIKNVNKVVSKISKNNILKQMKTYNCDLKNKPTSTNDKIKLFMDNLKTDLKEIYTKSPNKTTIMRFIKSIDWVIYMSIPFYILLGAIPQSVKTSAMATLPTIKGDALPLIKSLIGYTKIGFIWVLMTLTTLLLAMEGDNTELIIMVMLPYILLGGCEILVLPNSGTATTGN